MRWNRATVSVWVKEKTCPMCSFPLTVSGGVSMAKTSPREAERSNVYYAGLFPPARPLLLDAVKRGLARHGTGLARVRRAAGAGIGAQGGKGTSRRRSAAGMPGGGRRDGLVPGPARAAEHLPQPLIQRLADLVHGIDRVDHGTLRWGQPGRLLVVQPGADMADRDQLDLAGVDEAQPPLGGDDQAIEQVLPRHPEDVLQGADLLPGHGEHGRAGHGGTIGDSRLSVHAATPPLHEPVRPPPRGFLPPSGDLPLSGDIDLGW